MSKKLKLLWLCLFLGCILAASGCATMQRIADDPQSFLDDSEKLDKDVKVVIPELDKEGVGWGAIGYLLSFLRRAYKDKKRKKKENG